MIIINIYKLLKNLLISRYKMQFSTEPAEIIVQYSDTKQKIMATSQLEVLWTISFLICISYCLADQFKYPRACWPTSPLPEPPLCRDDVDNLQFAQNLEHLEAELFLGAGLGYGLDKVAPYFKSLVALLQLGLEANLDNLTRAIITEFGYQEVGHLR